MRASKEALLAKNGKRNLPANYVEISAIQAESRDMLAPRWNSLRNATCRVTHPSNQAQRAITMCSWLQAAREEVATPVVLTLLPLPA